jgi:hypothetical protein
MKIAYLDAFSGISGDMLLGALVDAGVPLAHLKRELKRIPVDGYRLTASPVRRHGIAATKVDVHLTKHSHPARTWNDVQQLIRQSSLPDNIASKGLRIFEILFQAEAKVHGVAFEKAHLHELAAVDCIVDIFGAVLGLTWLGIEQIFIAPINLGSGTVKTDHGILPVPAPATAELLKGFVAYGSLVPFELTTPTGASILAGLGAISAPMPPCRPITTAHGAGNRDLDGQPNVLRLTCAEALQSAADTAPGTLTMLIETNIDDMNPQIYEDVMAKLFAAGALDVWLEQIVMKKSRPGTKLCVLADESMTTKMADIVFRETTAIGIRFYPAERIMLDRTIETIRLPYGTARIKIARLGETVMNHAPEFDDLKTLSQKTGMPIKQITADIMRAVSSEKPVRHQKQGK